MPAAELAVAALTPGTLSAPGILSASGTLFPPVTYSPWWTVLAIGILLLIATFVVVVLVMTRTPPPEPHTGDASWIPDIRPEEVREKYLALIADVDDAHRRGELDAREAHQRLSMLLRFFAYESRGIRAPQMTLADLREARVTPLSEAVARLYPDSFAEVLTGSVTEATAMAKRVVHTWN
ncbi:hypothetical protein [Marisediminicola senii]|uniref:hypothetical protein n=1 Tax=Marisediminicola senii TaxID=2711233 RepID=UPI0013EDE960|nr:hypothetical protein [Marisediminicola senii]